MPAKPPFSGNAAGGPAVSRITHHATMSVKNVKRIDTGRTHGWQVCIQRDGEQTTKLFSDKKYGGREEALELAKEYRDELLEDLPSLPEGPNAHLHTDRTRQQAWKTLTRTGVKGISLTWAKGKSGTRYPHVCAMWPDPETGRRKRRARSVSKHGLDYALHRCCELLYEGRGEIDPDPEALYERAYPVIKELIEARREEQEAREEARRRSAEAKAQAMQDG